MTNSPINETHKQPGELVKQPDKMTNSQINETNSPIKSVSMK
jgi:hypothetical protein